MPRWVYAMTQHDLPEGFKATMELEGKEIVEVVLANVGGTICAFENPCPHDGGALGEGDLLGDEIVCPLHGGRFNVRTGASSTDPRLSIRTFPVRIQHEEVHVEC